MSLSVAMLAVKDSSLDVGNLVVVVAVEILLTRRTSSCSV